jgi:hypothetical protein
VGYLEVYGAVWHLVPAIVFIAGDFGIAIAPNKAAKTTPVTPPADPGVPASLTLTEAQPS